jgi:hypothetical protein
MLVPVIIDNDASAQATYTLWPKKEGSANEHLTQSLPSPQM